jgi:two-component system response regulator HydG
MAPMLVGRSTAVSFLLREIDKIASTDTTVLLTGETGTGKGLVARRIHALSRRSSQPFVHVDCASLAENIIESELFGHERGSFTGAHERRVGRFEQAERGTIFLDEIGELDPRIQAKLLRVLQDRQYERIGGGRTLTMGARVIAATNVDLETAMVQKRFRADLYFRLRVLVLVLPPLRKRLEDIPDLVRHGLADIAERVGRSVPRIDDSFMEALLRHSWPGNVRELLNALERVVVLADGSPLAGADLPRLLDGPHLALPAPVQEPVLDPALEDGELCDGRPDREEIASVLMATGGNVARSARRLKLPRSTLRYQIRSLRLQHLIPSD